MVEVHVPLRLERSPRKMENGLISLKINPLHIIQGAESEMMTHSHQ